MTLSVRRYGGKDRAACALIFYRAVREGAAGAYDTDQLAAWAPSPLPDLGEPDKLLDQWCWVAERGSAVVGFMSLEQNGNLDMAFVLPEEMGKGTATALYAPLLAKAHAMGFARMTVIASHLCRPFLAKHGWVVDRPEDMAADGHIYAVFHMSLDLSDDRVSDATR